MAYDLPVPLPDRLALISQRTRQYETDDWIVQTPRHRPEDTLIGHLTFALKYEGIDLCLLLKKLFERLSPAELVGLVAAEPTGQYSRRIWFLYEWLLQVSGPFMKLNETRQKLWFDITRRKFAPSLNEFKLFFLLFGQRFEYVYYGTRGNEIIEKSV